MKRAQQIVELADASGTQKRCEAAFLIAYHHIGDKGGDDENSHHVHDGHGL